MCTACHLQRLLADVRDDFQDRPIELLGAKSYRPIKMANRKRTVKMGVHRFSRDLASCLADQVSNYWDSGNLNDNGTQTKPVFVHVSQNELLALKEETSSSRYL